MPVFLNSFNYVFPSLPPDWSIGVGTEGGAGAMVPLLFEVGAGMINVQWAPRFLFSRYKWFLVILVCRPTLNKKGMVEVASCPPSITNLRSTKYCSAVGYTYPPHSKIRVRRPWPSVCLSPNKDTECAVCGRTERTERQPLHFVCDSLPRGNNETHDPAQIAQEAIA